MKEEEKKMRFGCEQHREEIEERDWMEGAEGENGRIEKMDGRSRGRRRMDRENGWKEQREKKEEERE